jgi:hypothetical protein
MEVHAMAAAKKTMPGKTLSKIVDPDRYAALKRIERLYLLRWLEKQRLVRSAAEFYIKKFM